MPGTLQTANPQMATVSRKPQTTTTPATGAVPFTRVSRQMQIPGPSIAGLTFGTLYTPTLRPVGGYMSSLRLTFTATGGVGAATAAADAPYSLIQSFMLRDPYGQPIFQADGYGTYLINKYSGQLGMLNFGNNPGALPSFSAPGGSGGNFNFLFEIPLQMDSSAYCSLVSMNASSQPQLQVQLNPTGSVYTAPPATTVPTIAVSITEPFWGAPVDHPEYAPPDVGSSGQWSMSRVQGLVGSATYSKLVLPRVGTWIHTLILLLRDSTGARIDNWPTTDLTLWIDGVPILQETLQERTDKMYAQFGVTRDTGVVVYSFRQSVQTAISTADTYDCLLPTTPATLLEISGTFGTITNAPATITVYTGELYPIRGIPYTHLAQ